MQNNEDDQRLPDLAAEVMAGRLTPTAVSDMRIAMARIEGKLDVALSVKEDFEHFEREMRAEITDITARLIKLESTNVTLKWLLGALTACFVAGFGALASYILGKI